MPPKMRTRQVTRKEESEASMKEEEKRAAGKARKLKKRQAGLFVRKDNKIRKNDMITDPAARKVKLEPDESASPVVKQEAEELQQEGTSDMEMWEDDLVSNMNAGEQASGKTTAVVASTPAVIASTSAQYRDELLQTRLQIKKVAVKIESPGTFHADEVIVMSELDIPNDDDQEEQVGEESNLPPEESETANYGVLTVTNFETVRTENEELRSLLTEQALENKRLRDENEKSKLSSLNNRQVSSRADEDAMNMDTGDQASTPTVSSMQVLQTLEIKTLETENEQLRTLLAQKEAENKDRTDCESTSQLEGDIARETGASSSDMTLELVKMKNVLEEKEIQIQQLKKPLRKERIYNYLRKNAEEKITTPLLTREEKVLQLFPDVLKIIIHKEPRLENCVHWRKLMPLLTACRPVCKSWKESVDRILQQDSGHFDLGHPYGILENQKRDFTPCPLLISYPAFDNARWTAELEGIRCQPCHPVGMNRSYNPIPSRHLMLYANLPRRRGLNNTDNDPVKWANYCQTVTTFLQVAGEQVWYFTLHFSYFGDTGDVIWLPGSMAIFRYLFQWFSLLPNLRSLSLSAKSTTPLENFLLEIEEISFPKFEQLETLTLVGIQETQLFYTILKNNRHVNRLALIPRSSSITVSMDLDLPNLSALHCKFHDAKVWETFVRSATWKLRDLTVIFCGFKCEKPTGAQFAEGVAKFGSTLKSLTFDPSPIGVGNGEDVELNLPQLKNLHLPTWKHRLFHPQVRLALLENLESLSMDLKLPFGSAAEVPTQLIEQVTNLDDYDNKDWMKLPKLRNIKISLTVNMADIGEPDVIVKRRNNMPSVIFTVPKMKLDNTRLNDILTSLDD